MLRVQEDGRVTGQKRNAWKMIFDDDFIQKLRVRYRFLHPLVIQRSMERASDVNELFEILESVPKNPPFSWSEKARRWKKDMDISAKKKMKRMGR